MREKKRGTSQASVRKGCSSSSISSIEEFPMELLSSSLEFQSSLGNIILDLAKTLKQVKSKVSSFWQWQNPHAHQSNKFSEKAVSFHKLQPSHWSSFSDRQVFERDDCRNFSSALWKRSPVSSIHSKAEWIHCHWLYMQPAHTWATELL